MFQLLLKGDLVSRNEQRMPTDPPCDHNVQPDHTQFRPWRDIALCDTNPSQRMQETQSASVIKHKASDAAEKIGNSRRRISEIFYAFGAMSLTFFDSASWMAFRRRFHIQGSDQA